MGYLLHLAIIAMIYMILAMSLNLLVGYSRIISLAHGAFYGIGAYVSAIAALHLGFGFFPALLTAFVITAFIAMLTGWPILRLREDYLVLALIALQIVVSGVITNWEVLTRGPFGLYGIPRPILFGWRMATEFAYLWVVVGAGVVLAVFAWQLHHSPFARVLRALREDELVTAMIGKNVAWAKVRVFGTSAGIAGVAGGLYAHYVGFISPANFTLVESIFVFTSVVIGGPGNFWGPLVGALFLVLLPEALRFIGLPSGIAAPVQQVVYGGVLILLMLVRPQGLIGEFNFKQE
jgi:branched-chain amino acid transport system permease protein